jgi:type VI secretion system protein ImpC
LPGVSAFIAEILKSNDPDQLINKHRVDQMIAEIDRVLGKQMDAILHHPEFQQLESSWRSLKLAGRPHQLQRKHQDRNPQRLQEDLLDDFENARITCSGLYKHVYTAGTASSVESRLRPWLATTSSAPLAGHQTDEYMASVGAMSHAPFSPHLPRILQPEQLHRSCPTSRK